MKTKHLAIALSLILFCAPVAQAGLLDETFSPITIDFNTGDVSINIPTSPQEVVNRVQNFVDKAPAAVESAVRDLFNPAGAALAMAIRHGQAQARHGAQSIPANIRSELAGIIPDSVLNDVSWNSLDKNRIDLANLTLLHNESVEAITLGNVIVFDRLEDANNNWKLWAHELFHTTQYKSMGIELFAHNYVVDHDGIEGPAYQFADTVEQRVRERRQNGSTRPIQYYRSGPESMSSYMETIQGAMKRYAPARACLDIEDNDGRPTVSNVCNTPVFVSSYVEVDRRTGRRFPGNCTEIPGRITCAIGPGMTLPVITPRSGCIEEVRFSFFNNGYGSEEDSWEGDCSEFEVDDDYIDDDDYGGREQQMGQSCCMFNGGRCGPFTNQPAYPVGSPCSCQHNNPYANGQVCKP